MKKFLVMLLSVCMLVSLTACGGSGESSEPSDDSETPKYSVSIDGQSMDPEELFTMNDLKKSDSVGKPIEVTGTICEVNGPIRYHNIVEADSAIEIQITDSDVQYIMVDTSGLEDTIMNWSVGDTVTVKGNVSFFVGDVLYITSSEQTKEGFTITNETTGDSVVNFEKEVLVLNDIDSDTYQAIENILLSDEENYWEYTDSYGAYYQIIFNNGYFKAVMTISGSSIANEGTYVIKDQAIVVTYDNGSQVMMRYTYENGELTYLGEIEEYVQ